MSKIKKIIAKEILDSRGIPTLSVSCELSGGEIGVASIPSGKSTGEYEALELRDQDSDIYDGKGVLKAIENVNNEINLFFQDKDFVQNTLDEALIKLDGTENKVRLGANAILGVSLAFARAVAVEAKLELFEYLGTLVNNSDFKMPQPLLNVINGGKHSDSGLDLQEFMLVPVGFNSFEEKIKVGNSIIVSLKKILEDKNYETILGDEGGFAPKLLSNEEAIQILVQAIRNAGYKEDEVKIGIDSAASSFFKNGNYILKVSGNNENKDSGEMIAWYENLVQKYPIVFIEDALAENDWEGFTELTRTLGDKIKIVGDDLTVTNVKRINMAIEKKAINAVLIKLNQIGTLSETIQAIKLTKEQGWAPFVSHRSGETMDTFIADLAVGLDCPYIKAGSLTKEERMCKYNRLMEIETFFNKR